jgi:hypothetical protein
VVVADALGAVVAGQIGSDAGNLVASGCWPDQAYVSAPVGVVLALPFNDTLAVTFGNEKLPTVPPPVRLVLVGMFVSDPSLANVTVCGVAVLFRFAVGAELETVSVCVTGTLVPRVEAVSWTSYIPPDGDVATLSIAGVPQDFVTSSTGNPSSNAPAGPDKTCHRQVTGEPGVFR